MRVSILCLLCCLVGAAVAQPQHLRRALPVKGPSTNGGPDFSPQLNDMQAHAISKAGKDSPPAVNKAARVVDAAAKEDQDVPALNGGLGGSPVAVAVPLSPAARAEEALNTSFPTGN